MFFKTKGHRGDVGKQPAEMIPIRSAGRTCTEGKVDAGEKTRSDLGRLQGGEAGREGKASCKHPNLCLFIIEGDKEIFVYSLLVLRVDAVGRVRLWMKFWERLRA